MIDSEMNLMSPGGNFEFVCAFFLTSRNMADGRTFGVETKLVSFPNSVELFTLKTSWREINPAMLNPLKAQLIPICHFVALLGAHHILHLSRIRVNIFTLMV